MADNPYAKYARTSNAQAVIDVFDPDAPDATKNPYAKYKQPIVNPYVKFKPAIENPYAKYKKPVERISIPNPPPALAEIGQRGTKLLSEAGEGIKKDFTEPLTEKGNIVARIGEVGGRAADVGGQAFNAVISPFTAVGAQIAKDTGAAKKFGTYVAGKMGGTPELAAEVGKKLEEPTAETIGSSIAQAGAIAAGGAKIPEKTTIPSAKEPPVIEKPPVIKATPQLDFSREATARAEPMVVPKEPKAAAPPVKIPPPVAPGVATRVGDDFNRIFSPASRGDTAMRMSGIARENIARQEQEYQKAATNLRQYSKAVADMPEPARYDFMGKIEQGKTEELSPALKPVATEIRRLFDDRYAKIQKMGKAEHIRYVQDYFPHIWKDPKAAESVYSGIIGRRPLEGSKAFTRGRTVDSIETGRQAGLELVTDNPIELSLLKLREMDKFITAHSMFDEMKSTGLTKFFRIGEKRPEGWAKINDKIADIKRPVSQVEGFDKQFRQRLLDLGNKLGFNHERSLNLNKTKAAGGIKVGSGTWGLARRDIPQYATKFGGTDFVIAHEFGHLLDFKYGLADRFSRDPAAWKELQALADKRASGAVDPQFKSYLRNPRERIANMVHAYLYAPDLMKTIAPHALKELETFIDRHPELAEMKTIRPGVELGTARMKTGELTKAGDYYAPEQAATIVNNYLSPGLRNSAIYDVLHSSANMMNQVQLGLSGFHAAFVAMDAMTSGVATGIKQISRGEPVRGLVQVLKSIQPGKPIMTYLKGRKVLNQYLGRGQYGKEMEDIVNGLISGGGRVTMDNFYRNSAAGSFWNAIRRGTVVSESKEMIKQSGKFIGSGRIFLRALDTVAAPIMENMVPRMKLGVFFEMMQDEMRKNPAMSLPQKRMIAGKLWDSVDNRLGQLVYDNLFWNRMLKDLAHISVRSVGWNLGTIREIGGGVADVTKTAEEIIKGDYKNITDRTAYVIAMPLVIGMYGALYGYAKTGQAPQELRDYFFPKTGGTDNKGNPVRVSLPGYMKDVYEYGHDPYGTLKSKINPLWSTLDQMLENKDFYGAPIHNPNDPWVRQVRQYGEFLGEQFLPFTLRPQTSTARDANLNPFERAMSLHPAPYFIRNPEGEKRYNDFQMRKALKAKAKREQQ